MKKLLVIVGPTGTGKTALALHLAKKFDGELVSSDSRQLYKGMDLGTGKTPVKEKIKGQKGKVEKHDGFWVIEAIKVHLYDVIDPGKTFSMAAYQQLAYKAIEEIHSQNKLPILVGGTGLYVQAVAEGLKIPKVVPDEKLREKLESKSLEALISELERVDPESVSKIDIQNPRRIIRALEVYYQTGESFSKLKNKFKVDFDLLQVGLTAKREYLYNRVDKQVDKWFENGFVEEVKTLLKKGYKENLTSMTSLGYRQVIMYIANRIPLSEAKQRIKWELHGYIRRQITWFKRNSAIIWFDIEEPSFVKEVENKVNKWL